MGKKMTTMQKTSRQIFLFSSKTATESLKSCSIFFLSSILSKLFLPFFVENINESYKRHNIPLKNLYSKMSLKVWIYRYFLAKLAKNCQKTSPLKRLQLSGMFYIGTRTWYHLGMQNTFPDIRTLVITKGSIFWNVCTFWPPL